jgi:hypothetical protein
MKFVRYLEQWKKRERWRLASPDVPQMFFGALLRGELFEEALFGTANTKRARNQQPTLCRKQKARHFPSGL